MICEDFIEHEHWRAKHPTGPVTWDAWCSECGFKLEDRQWASGHAIEGNGRRLERVRPVIYVGDERFVSDKRRVGCSQCYPQILGRKTE